MAAAISMEMGAPTDLATTAQAGCGIGHIQGVYRRLCRDGNLSSRLMPRTVLRQIIKEPIGVCGLITPWNWPMNQVTLKVIPALGGRLHCGP